MRNPKPAILGLATSTVVMALILGSANTFAQGRTPTPWQVTEGDVTIPSFQFQSGDTLGKLTIHYATIGTPRRDSGGRVTNAIMLLHGTGGSGRGFAGTAFGNEVYGPGQAFDITKYFIVLPDDIGHGGSSKPSNGMGASFPKYTYADMVKAEHILSERLGIGRFELIGGHSMGCMHTFMWGVTYPDAMKRLLPMACIPTAIAGRNRWWRKMLIESIRSDPAYMDGRYTSEPLYGIREALFIQSFSTTAPGSLQRQFPTRKEVDEHIDEMLKAVPKVDANDMIWEFDASRDYNPEPDLGNIQAKLLWITTGDDFVNPPDAGLIAKMRAKLKPDQYRLIPIGPDTLGHSTTMQPRFWKDWAADFMRD